STNCFLTARTGPSPARHRPGARSARRERALIPQSRPALRRRFPMTLRPFTGCRPRAAGALLAALTGLALAAGAALAPGQVPLKKTDVVKKGDPPGLSVKPKDADFALRPDLAAWQREFRQG